MGTTKKRGVAPTKVPIGACVRIVGSKRKASNAGKIVGGYIDSESGKINYKVQWRDGATQHFLATSLTRCKKK